MDRLLLAEALHKSLAEVEQMGPGEFRLWQALWEMRRDAQPAE